MTSFNLSRVKLRSGEEFRDEIEVELPVFALAGQHYGPVSKRVPAELTITRATTGTVFTLAFHGQLHGPCYRCLGDAVLELPIHAREYQAEAPDDEELTTPYLAGDRLEVSNWARDGVALALPEQILCRPDCAGLCAVCGKNLNDEPHDHDVEEADPRWSALESLRQGS